jgi:hypothetical protein
VQPAQLSLLADQLPTPMPVVLAELPETDVGEAISLLGALIAKASTSTSAETASGAEVNGDE